MKKLLPLAAAALFLFSVPPQQCQAQDKPLPKPEVRIHKASKPVKVDCDLSKYPGYTIRMDKQSYEILMYNVWSGKEDLSADIYMLWDDDALYVAAKVTDDVPFDNSKEGPDIWDGDALEIMLGLDDKADPKRMFFGKKDYQIGISPGNEKDIKAGEWVWRRDDYVGGIEVASVRWDKGYIIESKIPFKALGGFKPEVGRKIDFDISVDDADTHKRELQFTWYGTKNVYADPSEWGIAVFAAPAPALALSFSSVMMVIIGLIVIAVFLAFVARRPK
ncbi:MAG: sugar-binding protein [Candidatus Omnitrophota bacterium]